MQASPPGKLPQVATPDPPGPAYFLGGERQPAGVSPPTQLIKLRDGETGDGEGCQDPFALAGIVAEVDATFARAEKHAKLEAFEDALRWLATGEELCGGLTPGYLAKRVRWKAGLTRQGLSQSAFTAS